MDRNVRRQLRDRLLDRRHALERLRRDNETEAGQLLEAQPLDVHDRATNREGAQVLSRLSDQERAEIADIDEALGRLDLGSFGVCQRCGGTIGLQRLQAIPEARYCLACRSVDQPAAARGA